MKIKSTYENGGDEVMRSSTINENHYIESTHLAFNIDSLRRGSPVHKHGWITPSQLFQSVNPHSHTRFLVAHPHLRPPTSPRTHFDVKGGQRTTWHRTNHKVPASGEPPLLLQSTS
ncbi:hypothetical protein Scep_014469 [Stephania cephalantha]|uniref:Uncharacterized protein n=1 Tax=Stephania cephalantha TaxID=152367 RepID=A0AAP0J1D7_9MAGN